MTPLELNAMGFEGDMILKAEFKKLIEKHNINIIFETGSYLGHTTRQLANIYEVEWVYTFESNPHYYQETHKNINEPENECENVTNVLGDSSELMGKYIMRCDADDNVLFFLDAHWNANNPLLQELDIIATAKLRPVIIVHDFKVPDHPELGFDTYNGQDYEWSWIEQSIENIYGKDGYTYYYNSEAEGAKRGVIFIEPK